MSDLRAAIVDEIDRIDRISIGIPPPLFRAVRAVVDRHNPKTNSEPSPTVLRDVPFCDGCGGYWTSGVCDELRAIADAFGIAYEVDPEPAWEATS